MRWLIACLVFAVSAVAAHFWVLTSIPGFIISTADSRMAEQGVPEYQWTATPRQTPETQRIVRPSPDLSYSLCRFDVRHGPVFITAPTWDGYGSLSIFNDQTDNVFVGDLGPDSVFSGIVVSRPGAQIEADVAQPTVQVEGVALALIRRLAPDAERYDLAASLVDQSVCELLN
ncbi:MAG: DUF1254 domain-containing protein [Pseudomonadota bacterium]